MDANQLSADQLIQYLSWAFYVLIFVVVIIKAVRRPVRPNFDIALFFTLTALVILLSVLTSLGVLPSSPILADVQVAMLLALAYALMRLTDDFSQVPRWLMRASEAGLALTVLGNVFFTFYPPTPKWFTVVELLYLVFFLAYPTIAFVRESRRTSGVTSRRMSAIAVGSGSLILGFLILGFGGLLFPDLAGLLSTIYDVLGLVSGIGFFLGFATPTILRRAWQEPELRAFLERAANLPRLPDTQAILREMERGAADSIGAPRASIGLWDEGSHVLRFELEDGEVFDMREGANLMSAKVFRSQRPMFSPNIQRDYPENVTSSRRYSALALLAAPITAGKKRLGVLTVFAPHAPVFADEDLNLVQLLADQAAVILESRALIDDAARVRAREEVARLKEDFLSAAAHDLKTPLTTLVAQTQLLERRAMRAPDMPVDIAGIQKLVRETERLRSLVMELLDASRAEQGKLVGEIEEVDLVALARETCERYNSERHPCGVDAGEPVTGTYDRNRILQLLENLVENAVKYSPTGGPVRIKVWKNDTSNHLAVSDQGIGIPAQDLPYVFERFHRGTNVDDRRFAGMGLGLYICRGIAEQHGGDIRALNNPAGGTTFEVTLPSHVPSEMQAIAEIRAS